MTPIPIQEKKQSVDASSWITSIHINHQPLSLDQIDWDAAIELPFRHNSLQIDIKKKESEDLTRYGYQLLDQNGSEIDRIDLGDQTRIYLSALQSGEYQLILFSRKAKYGTLITENPLSFLVNKPFYRSWWFVLMGMCGYSSLLYTIFKYRFQSSEKTNNQRIEPLKQETIEEEDEIRLLSNAPYFTSSKAELELSEEPSIEKIQALKLKVPELQNWELFKQSFEEVYPQFFTKLTLNHPNLNEQELWMSGLMKLNLGHQKMSDLLFVSRRTIESRKYRLKKKLKLEPSIDLKEFISNY